MNKDKKFPALRAYLKFIKPYRYKLAFVLLLFVLSNTLLALIPIFIGGLIETLSKNPQDTSAWWYVAALVGSSSFHDILWRCSEFAYRGLLLRISFDYETHLFHSVVRQPYPYFIDKFTGKIASYITSTTAEFRTLLSDFCFNYSSQIVSLVVIVFILGSLNWQTAAIFVVGLVGMFAVGRYTIRRDMAAQGIEADANASKNGVIFDSIANFANVKSFRSNATEIKLVNAEQENTLKKSMRSFLWGIVFWSSMSLFVRHFMWASIIILNAYYFFEGALSIGQLATLLATALIFSSSIWDSVWHISQFGLKMARVDEAHNYLFGDAVPVSANRDKGQGITFEKELAIKNMTFAYPDMPDTDVLQNVSLNIKHGEKIGVVGRSGSGKSTLTKLFLNYYPVTSGTLSLDGQLVTGDELAENIAFVPQDTSLFHRSIADNIAYGTTRKVTREEVIKAAKLAEADEFVVKLKDGYDTLVGERGVKLSGGQRQRIAIARAIIHDSPILLLDEATSALDSDNEMLIQKALQNLWGDKTVIAIAHRLSTLRHMDRIAVFEDGKIVELGTHSELLAKDGIYANLWAHQSGGFIEE